MADTCTHISTNNFWVVDLGTDIGTDLGTNLGTNTRVVNTCPNGGTNHTRVANACTNHTRVVNTCTNS